VVRNSEILTSTLKSDLLRAHNQLQAAKARENNTSTIHVDKIIKPNGHTNFFVNTRLLRDLALPRPETLVNRFKIFNNNLRFGGNSVQ